MNRRMPRFASSHPRRPGGTINPAPGDGGEDEGQLTRRGEA